MWTDPMFFVCYTIVFWTILAMVVAELWYRTRSVAIQLRISGAGNKKEFEARWNEEKIDIDELGEMTKTDLIYVEGAEDIKRLVKTGCTIAGGGTIFTLTKVNKVSEKGVLAEAKWEGKRTTKIHFCRSREAERGVCCGSYKGADAHLTK